MGLTKFGVHIIGWDGNVLKFIERTKPAIIKVVGPFGHNTEYLKTAKRMSPDSKWLFRLYRDNQPLDAPSYHAEVHARLMEPYIEHYDIFEGYNEIDPRDHSKDPPGALDIEIIKRYNEFDSRVANIVNLEWGKEYCGLNWSNGQPPDEAWEYLRDALTRADYIGLHNYGWETLPDCPQFALRHRKIFDLLPVKKLMILSEVGMTDAVFGGPDVDDLGWRSWKKPYNLFAQEGRAAAVWAWFLDRINEDPYIVGANPYTTGRLKGDNWGTHDFTPRLYKLVGDYILGHPSPDPYLPNGGNDMENPIVVGIRENYKVWNSPIIRIKKMEMEEYLRRCVPYEVYPSWKLEALKAQAVAARTYAEYRKINCKHGDFDICNSACCQVMGPGTFSSTDKAVKATKDIVLRYEGKPIFAEYSANCGGFTKAGSVPYLKPRPCKCFEISPHKEVLYGHGRGLCQWGAEEMARRGKTYREILTHYYTLGQPAPDWEAKYKHLRNRVDEVSGLTAQIQSDLDRIVNDDFRDLSRLREAIDELLE